jgi:hypothetical protein
MENLIYMYMYIICSNKSFRLTPLFLLEHESNQLRKRRTQSVDKSSYDFLSAELKISVNE